MPGLRLGLGLRSAAITDTGAPASPNPNLLLWSEALDNAAWTANLVTVTANAANDPDGQPTADRLAFGLERRVVQATVIAATTGDPVTTTPTLTTAWEPYTVSGTFDGSLYYYTHYLREETAAGRQVRLFIERSGGFIASGIEDLGDEVMILAAWAKLETPTLTAYVKREGT